MISAILLAAGESKRMNGENKLLKKINDKPLISHSVTNILESSIDELIIVIGHEAKKIKQTIKKNKKIKFVFNNKYKTGMASSIIEGLKNLPLNTKSFFICLGDMPAINKNVYNQLIKEIKNNEIVVPTYKKKQGNPVLFSSSFKEKIMIIKGDSGAKKILEKNKERIFNFEIDDKGILKNYNTLDSFSS